MVKKENTKSERLSKSHPLLLAYAIFYILYTLLSLSVALHYINSQTSSLKINHSQRTSAFVIVCLFGLVILYVYYYLIFTANRKRVNLILRVLLGFALISFLVDRAALDFIVSFSQAAINFLVIKNINRDVPRTKKIKNKK